MTPDKGGLTRAVQVGLLVNSLMATIAGLGFIGGFAPHAAEHAMLARRVGAAELAGAFMMVFVALRLRAEARWIALPLAFVGANFAVSIIDIVSSRSSKDAPPLVVEGIFFTLYAIFAATRRRRR